MPASLFSRERIVRDSALDHRSEVFINLRYLNPWVKPQVHGRLLANQLGHVSGFIMLNKNAKYLHQRCKWMTLVFSDLVN